MKYKLTFIDYMTFSAVVTIIGILLNRLVIDANNGMPVPWLIDASLIIRFTKFGILGDILPFYTSIGDWLIWLGLASYLVALALFIKSGIINVER